MILYCLWERRGENRDDKNLLITMVTGVNAPLTIAKSLQTNKQNNIRIFVLEIGIFLFAIICVIK